MYTIENVAKISNKLYKNKNPIKVFNNKKNDYNHFRFEINSDLANQKLDWKAKINLKQGLNLIINKRCE